MSLEQDYFSDLKCKTIVVFPSLYAYECHACILFYAKKARAVLVNIIDYARYWVSETALFDYFYVNSRSANSRNVVFKVSGHINQILHNIIIFRNLLTWNINLYFARPIQTK
jgi:hypothetical protein